MLSFFKIRFKNKLRTIEPEFWKKKLRTIQLHFEKHGSYKKKKSVATYSDEETYKTNHEFESYLIVFTKLNSESATLKKNITL